MLIRIYVLRKGDKQKLIVFYEKGRYIIMAILRMFKNSAMELKSLRCITVTAMLIALDLALKNVTVYLSEDTKISFAYLALASIGMLFGPTVGLLAGIVTDILGMIVAQSIGAFNPLFTIVEASGAMIYGMFLYGMKYVKIDFKNIKFFEMLKNVWRILAAKLAVVVVCNIVLNPLAMIICGYWTVETTIMVKIPTRLIKYAIQTPIDWVLMILILYPVLLAYKTVFREKERSISA